MRQPYLSIILAVRNDNYGGDFTQRLQNCIDWNTRLLEQFGIDAELVMVNWNPLTDAPSLLHTLQWPQHRKHVNYRIIDVPAALHQLYVDPAVRDTAPMFEFIAKNVGIRRAVGQFLLCINADILIHPSIFRAIAAKNLNTATYYRANRLDYHLTQDISVNGLTNAGFAVSLKGFMYQFNAGISKKLQYHILKKINVLRLKWELFKFRHVALSNTLRLNVVYNNGAYYAHCLNSGDFMLMSKAQWMELAAYPEYTAISTHTDALFTLLASTKWAEYVFSQPVFHQEHARRYAWDAIKNDQKFVKAYAFFEEVANAVKRAEPIDGYLNNATWGLQNIELEEHIIAVS